MTRYDPIDETSTDDSEFEQWRREKRAREAAQQHDTQPITPIGASRPFWENPSLLTALGIGTILALIAVLALWGPQPAAVQTESALQPSADVQQPTRTPDPPTRTATPTDTPLPVFWTNNASWTPQGERFVIEKAPVSWFFLGDQVGDRCHVRLPADPNGGTPEPWVPCSILH